MYSVPYTIIPYIIHLINCTVHQVDNLLVNLHVTIVRGVLLGTRSLNAISTWAFRWNARAGDPRTFCGVSVNPS
jgi:hypothetical protein